LRCQQRSTPTKESRRYCSSGARRSPRFPTRTRAESIRRSAASRCPRYEALAEETCLEKVSMHARDGVDADLLRARRLTFAEERAAAECLEIHLRDHVQRAPVALRLTLRQQSEVRDLRGGKERR